MTQLGIVKGLRGIFPPLVTPFNRRGDVDEGAFRANLERYAGLDFGGVLVAGSTGEAPYLTESERLRLTDLARSCVKPPKTLLVGTGLECTQATIRLSREVVARGADALLVVTPSYYKARMDRAALAAHYCAVADCVRRPVVIYSIPQFTGIRVEADLITRLSHHPNIVGLKESSGELSLIQAVLGKKYRRDFRVLVGSALILVPALEAGASGGVLAQACFAPELCLAAFRAHEQKNLKAAIQLTQRLELLVRAVSAKYGVAGVKAAMDLMGYAGGAPRLPLLAPKPAERREIAQALAVARNGLDL